MYTNPLSKPTDSQQTWQSQYDTLRLQQAAYKAQVFTLTELSKTGLTTEQTNLFKIAQMQQIDVETQLVNLKSNFDSQLNSRINAVGTSMSSMTINDPAYAQLKTYQDSLFQSQTELQAIAQNWVVPLSGSTTYTIDGYLYSNSGVSPQPVGATYAWSSVKNFFVGAVNGAVNVVDNFGAWKTDVSTWFNTLDPKLQYQVCKNNWDHAGTVMGATLPATLGIPAGLVGKIVDKAIGNANDHAFSIGANVCKGIMPKADLFSLMQNDMGTIPPDVMYALDSFGPQLEFTFSPDIAAQLTMEAAYGRTVTRMV